MGIQFIMPCLHKTHLQDYQGLSPFDAVSEFHYQDGVFLTQGRKINRFYHIIDPQFPGGKWYLMVCARGNFILTKMVCF